MAQKKDKSAKASKKEIRRRIIDASLRVASIQSWHDVSWVDIAQEAQLPLDDVMRAFVSKQDIVHQIVGDMDMSVLAGHLADDGVSKRDRLFDILMERFDAMNEHREAHCSFIQSYGWVYSEKMQDLKLYFCSLSRYAQASGLETGGLFGPMKVFALSVAYGWVLYVWMSDHTPDLVKTMAALDRALGRLEYLSDYIKKPASV